MSCNTGPVTRNQDAGSGEIASCERRACFRNMCGLTAPPSWFIVSPGISRWVCCRLYHRNLPISRTIGCEISRKIRPQDSAARFGRKIRPLRFGRKFSRLLRVCERSVYHDTCATLPRGNFQADFLRGRECKSPAMHTISICHTSVQMMDFHYSS